jgi:hypothetical protein
MGRRLLINFNKKVLSRTNVEGTAETAYTYQTARVDKLSDRNTIIEEIMKTHYPTFGSEIASLQGDPENEAQHSMLKKLAKVLADYWVNTDVPDLTYYPTNITPDRVTMRQARLALAVNALLQDVEGALAAMTEPDKTNATIEWEYSQYVDRGKQLVSLLGAALGLTDTQLDDLFIQASAL